MRSLATKWKTISVCSLYILSIAGLSVSTKRKLALISRVNLTSLLRYFALERLVTSANRERPREEERREAPSLPPLRGHYLERSLGARQELDCSSMTIRAWKTQTVV